MSSTYSKRVPMPEQLRLIAECRKSGMTDADWCRANGIPPSTFYNWVSRCRKQAAAQIPAPRYGRSETAQPKQDVVPIDIVPDTVPTQPLAETVQPINAYLDNSHSIEISVRDLTIRIKNDTDPVLLSRTLKLLQEFVC